MPHQENPERGPGGATPGGPDRSRTHGHRTAAPDAPHLPRQRHATPSRPPANATPPRGRPATARPTPPGGMPSSAQPPRPTRMMPGPGTPEPPPADPRPTRVTPPPTGHGPGGSGGAASGDGATTTKQAAAKSELGFSKIAAGAGAAVVTAVLGSFLGAVGTIIGAALGSIITTVATTFFQRSIERTQAQVVDKSQRLRERRTASRPGEAAWQAAAREGGTGVAGPDGQETVLIDPNAAGATTVAPSSGSRWRLRKMSRKSLIISAIAAALTFVLAMFLVTGIEWIKGSTITGGGDGTSIGNVVSGTSTQQQTGDDTSGDSTSTSESGSSTSDSTSDQNGQSNGTSQDDSNSNDSGSSSSTSTSNPLGGLNKIIPTQGNNGQLQSGQNGSGSTGGGADSSN